MRRAFLAALLIASGALAADAPQRPKLKLILRLAKTKWHLKEYLWYRLELHNNGSGVVTIHDRSWWEVQVMEKNIAGRRNTYLEALDDRGQPAPWRLEYLPANPYWINILTDYPHGKTGVFELTSGDSYATSPLKLRWRSGPSGRPPDSLYGARGSHFHVPGPPGFRVLPGRWIAMPGHYRMIAHLDERVDIPPASAEDEIIRMRRNWPAADWYPGPTADDEAFVRRSWSRMPKEELSARRQDRSELEAANASAPLVDSNVVEFEIVP